VTCALQPSRCSAISVASKNFGSRLFFRLAVNVGILSGETSRHRVQATKDERRHAGSYSSSKLKAAARVRRPPPILTALALKTGQLAFFDLSVSRQVREWELRFEQGARVLTIDSAQETHYLFQSGNFKIHVL
jgi:hypothetical protein